MELEKFKKAEAIKENIDELLKMYRFFNNINTHITLSNEWDNMLLSEDLRAPALDYLKKVTEERIKELEQQFKEI